MMFLPTGIVNISGALAVKRHGGYVFGLLAALLIAMAAQATDKLVLPPSYEDTIVEDMYLKSEQWREEQDETDPYWREAPAEKPSRMKFGFDPAYQDTLNNKAERNPADRYKFETTRPSSLFRLEF